MSRLGGFPQGRLSDPEDMPALIDEPPGINGRSGPHPAHQLGGGTGGNRRLHRRGELADGDVTSSWAAKVEYLVGAPGVVV